MCLCGRLSRPIAGSRFVYEWCSKWVFTVVLWVPCLVVLGPFVWLRSLLFPAVDPNEMLNDRVARQAPPPFSYACCMESAPVAACTLRVSHLCRTPVQRDAHPER